MNIFNLQKAAKSVFKVVSTSAVIFSVLFLNLPLKAEAVTQDISYTITDNGGPVVGYYNVRDSGNKVFNWNVDVNFNGPGGMHVVTIGAYDEQAGSAATIKHPFGVSSSGKVDYRNPPESGSFSFSYDTARDSRLGQCGRVQIDGSFINETSPTYDDSNLFFAMVIDYGVDCPPANTAPILTLVGSNPVTVISGTTYVDSGATAYDNEDGNITANIVRTGSVNTNVVGSYTLTYNVSDSQGLAATPVTRTVNVIAANQRPVITLIGSNPVTVVSGTTYVDAGATAHDNEDGNITSSIVKTGTVNTNIVGQYTLTYNVSDSKGLAAVPVTRTINVVANQRPIITLIGANPINIVAGATYTDAGATALDPEDGNITANIVRTGSVNTNVVGSYTLTYNVSDSQGLAATPVTRTVNVTPVPVNNKPVITLIGSNPLNIVAGSLYVEPGASASDIEDGNITSSIVITGTVNTLIAGSYTITYNVSDSQGLAADPVTRTVNVTPANQKPVITLVGLNPVSVVAGATYTDAGATALDPEDGNITANIVRTGSVNTNVVGSYTLTYNVSDSQGLAAFPVTRTVNVTPANQKPVITLIGNNPFNLIVGELYTDAGATALDPEDGDITYNIATTSNINNALVGNYTVTYNVSDSQGLAADQVVRNVDVYAAASNQCVIPDSAGDIQTESFGNISGEKSFSNLVSESGLKISTEQRQYQTWHTNEASTTVKVTFIGGITNAGDVFGYYIKGNKNTFVPLFTVGPNTNSLFSSVPVATIGQTYSVDVPSGDIAFAISSSVISGDLWTTENLLNDKNDDHVVTYDVATTSTSNLGSYVLGFEDLDLATGDKDYNDAVVMIQIESCHTILSNNPPVITLVGLNPATVNIGDTYIDPGATALDQEDGDITSHIQVTSTVNTAVVGTYTVTYNVSDSQGLAAVPVSRTVNVLDPGTGNSKGQITFCLALADNQNILATSSLGLPIGLFTINLATSTDLSGTLVQSKIWDTSSFAPNTKIILQQNDADCVTYSNLDLGTYYYSTTTITGSRWNVSKYNDKYNQTINNVFDFFNYSPELFTATTTDDSLRNMNSDGQIVLTADNNNQSVTIYTTYNPAPQCLLPDITSALTASVNVNNQFTYTLTASSSITNLSVATTSLPLGLTFSTTTNTITGTPTQAGTYNIDLTAVNNCGTTTAVLVLTVSSGGGGGVSPISNLSVTKVADKTSIGVGETLTYTVTVVNNGPDNATGVSLTEIFPSKLTLVSAIPTLGSYSTTTSIWSIGNLLNGSSTTLTLIGTVNSGTEGQIITNTVSVTANQSDPNTSNNSTTVDTNVNPVVVPPCTTCGGGGGGSNGPIVGSYGGSNGPVVPQVAGAVEVKACYYLYDYLRKDFNNNPVEVTKLQVFLRDLEGFKDIKVTGIYDDQTIVALNAFQWRYKDDVLTPWGHTAPTSYTYILTKKKVNEIYCKMAFPVNAQQQQEIDNYRNFLLSLKNAGINIPARVENTFPTSTTTVPTPAIEDVVGINTSPASTTNNTNSDGLTTLAGVSTTTRKIASDMTATVLLAGKRFANAAAVLLSWPFKDYTNRTTQCVKGLTVLGWLNIILVILILVVSYLWYREYKNNRILEDINKEIDLN